MVLHTQHTPSTLPHYQPAALLHYYTTTLLQYTTYTTLHKFDTVIGITRLTPNPEHQTQCQVGIMIGITSLDKPMSVSYQQFESFANTCVSLPLRADISQLYYRMMIRSHPDQLFPPSSLAMAITAVELEVSQKATFFVFRVSNPKHACLTWWKQN